MDIQSLSICVPSKGCQNDCKFCISKINTKNVYPDFIENLNYRKQAITDFKKRLDFARDNHCDTMLITSTGEPLLNISFIDDIANWNEQIDKPFRWIEIQTNGIALKDPKLLKWLRQVVGVSTISFSLSSIWDSKENHLYNGTPDKFFIEIEQICASIKKYGFNLRLSLNMTDFYNGKTALKIFKRAKELEADQVTFRVLYAPSDYKTEKSKKMCEWIFQHSCDKETLRDLNHFILKNGKELERLPFGALKYSVDGMSTVVDSDCMNQDVKDCLKYLILWPDCKIRSKWDDPASLIF